LEINVCNFLPRTENLKNKNQVNPRKQNQKQKILDGKAQEAGNQIEKKITIERLKQIGPDSLYLMKQGGWPRRVATLTDKGGSLSMIYL